MTDPAVIKLKWQQLAVGVQHDDQVVLVIHHPDEGRILEMSPDDAQRVGNQLIHAAALMRIVRDMVALGDAPQVH